MSNYEKKSSPGAVGNDMSGALKGNHDQSYLPKNYIGRPANAKPIEFSGQQPNDNFMPVSDWTQRDLQERRKYNSGKDSMWGQKYDNDGKHTNKSFWDNKK